LFLVPKICLVLCIAAIAPGLPCAAAQVLVAGNDGAAASKSGAMVLAGTARILHPDFAVHMMADPPSGLEDAMTPDFPVTVGFGEGSDRLTPRATRALDQLGLAMRKATLSSAAMRVEGHADSLGAPDSNRDLSKRRAEAVARYLEQNFGIGAGRFTCVGLGDRHPVVRQHEAAPEPRNRVVQVNLAGDG